MAKPVNVRRAVKPIEAAKQLVVTVADDKLHEIEQIAEQLRTKGMSVERVAKVMGVISGSSPRSKMHGLKSVEGVLSVEEELNAVPTA